MTERPLLAANEVTVWRGDREIIKRVSLELRAGEIVALLGPNGAGKSTLLEALGGALETAGGRIERNGRVALALQSPDLARRSALSNVMLALAWWGMPRPQRAERAREALQAIGAGHLSDRAAASLSGGERRRVHLARAIALAPDVLLLDEPFAGLDAEVRASLLEDSLSALRSSARATLVVVHDRAEAWALADRLLVLIDGQLVAEGAPRELLDHPPTAAVARFLGFDGTIERGGELLLTRPHHVTIDEHGPLKATVRRAIPLEDGVRLELELEGGHGKVFAVAPVPGPGVGDRVSLRVNGGARFASAGQPGAAGAGAVRQPVAARQPGGRA
jgi:ABC-type sulfate/molybdate transport systems ATPase subunit